MFFSLFFLTVLSCTRYVSLSIDATGVLLTSLYVSDGQLQDNIEKYYCCNGVSSRSFLFVVNLFSRTA